jgi:membrane-associated phospholipid phosphatase
MENQSSTTTQEKKYWFKAKSYGYGWYPASWQGWAILILFIAAIVYNFFRIDAAQHSVSDVLMSFVPETLLLVALLVLIAWITGEKASWKWGDKK